jgi:hypothetical protein
MPATPLINGINYSWANITVVLFGVPVVGILKIDYKRKQKKENNYGFGQNPVSRGYGNEEPDGAIELYTDEWNRIIAAAPERNPLKIPPFDIQISFSGPGVLTISHVLKSCEFTEDGFEAKQGDTKLTVNLPLIIGDIQK